LNKSKRDRETQNESHRGTERKKEIETERNKREGVKKAGDFDV
jgi:hypothetical protein